jgi:microcystin-dependent protein
MIGTVFPFITADPPDGSLELDGSTYNNADYVVLAGALDPAFDNGDGTFTLHDARGRAIIGAGTGTGLSARAVGDTIGEETHALIEAENAQHNHGYDQPVGEFLALTGEEPVVLVINPTAVTGDSGAGDPHENMQPSVALRYAVWFR